MSAAVPVESVMLVRGSTSISVSLEDMNVSPCTRVIALLRAHEREAACISVDDRFGKSYTCSLSS